MNDMKKNNSGHLNAYFIFNIQYYIELNSTVAAICVSNKFVRKFILKMQKLWQKPIKHNFAVE